MKIAIEDSVERGEEIFSIFGKTYLFNSKTIDYDELKTCDALIVRSTTKVNESLLKNTKIKFVGTTTAGYDHIDVKYLNENNIFFASAPGCNSRAVAEYVFCSIIALLYDKGANPDSLRCGIVGYGNIGTKVDKLLSAIGIKTLINDPPLEIICNNKNFFSDLNICLSADILTFHVPLINSHPFPTFNLLNSSLILNNLKSTIIINTSRGEVIDENEILNYANKNSSVDIILDVWKNEPYINLSMLERARFATPHIAGYSYLGKFNGTIIIAKKLANFFEFKYDQNFEKNIQEQKEIIKLNSNRDFFEKLYEAAQYVFNPYEETKKFKEQIKNSTDVGKAFDNYRKSYKLRKEFSQIQIQCDKLNDKEKTTFEKLGFYII